MRQWTWEERRKQAELIRKWQPWKRVVEKTEAGKAPRRSNAFKHGKFSLDTKAARSALKQSARFLKKFEGIEN